MLQMVDQAERSYDRNDYQKRDIMFSPTSGRRIRTPPRRSRNYRSTSRSPDRRRRRSSRERRKKWQKTSRSRSPQKVEVINDDRFEENGGNSGRATPLAFRDPLLEKQRKLKEEKERRLAEEEQRLKKKLEKVALKNEGPPSIPFMPSNLPNPSSLAPPPLFPNQPIDANQIFQQIQSQMQVITHQAVQKAVQQATNNNYSDLPQQPPEDLAKYHPAYNQKQPPNVVKFSQPDKTKTYVPPPLPPMMKFNAPPPTYDRAEIIHENPPASPPHLNERKVTLNETEKVKMSERGTKMSLQELSQQLGLKDLKKPPPPPPESEGKKDENIDSTLDMINSFENDMAKKEDGNTSFSSLSDSDFEMPAEKEKKKTKKVAASKKAVGIDVSSRKFMIYDFFKFLYF